MDKLEYQKLELGGLSKKESIQEALVSDFKNLQRSSLEKVKTSDTPLFIDTESSDSSIIERVSRSSQDLVEEFNNCEVVLGSLPSKKIIRKALTILKSDEFRSTELGNCVYHNYTQLLVSVSISELEINQGNIPFDPKILGNLVVYVTLGVSTDVCSLLEVSSELTNLLGLDSVLLKSKINLNVSQEISEIVANSSDKVKVSTDKITEDILKPSTPYLKLLKIFVPQSITSAAMATAGIALIGCGYQFGAFSLVTSLVMPNHSAEQASSEVAKTDKNSDNILIRFLAYLIEQLR